MAKKAAKKKCSHPGCRKMQVPGGETCKSHMGSNGVGVEPAPEIPVLEGVLRMTDLERLGLVKVETECVNILLQLRNHELETEEVKRKFKADLDAKAAHRVQLMSIAETRKAEQQRMVREIAGKYGLNPNQMVYDPDTGVLRDLTQGNQGSA